MDSQNCSQLPLDFQNSSLIVSSIVYLQYYPTMFLLLESTITENMAAYTPSQDALPISIKSY